MQNALKIKDTTNSSIVFKYLRNKKAPFFMKFYVVVNFYLVSLSFKFYEDPCINTGTRIVNMRAHVISRMCAFTTRARAFTNRSS